MKDFKIYLSVASLLLIIYLVAQYNRPAPVNWKSTLFYKDKVPFGTYVLYQQLPQIFQGSKISNTNGSLSEVLGGHERPEGNYFIIANTVDITKTDFNSLVKYVKAGNSVFISAFVWKGFLPDTLHLAAKSVYQKQASDLNFTNPKLATSNRYQFSNDISNQYFSRFDTTKAIVLGQNDLGKSNYLCFKFGKGCLYLCANPHLFTNINLLRPQGAEYVAKALSYLPPAQNIYWDEYQNGDIPVDESPMRVFFDHPNLQWAYYISLFGLLIYVIYGIKRQQRIIPIIEPLKNSTLDFVTTVGQVYYEQRDNTNITAKKITYLLEHFRTRYFLKTTNLDKEFIQTLAQKTGIAESFATDLVDHINYLSVQQKISDHELIILNRLIEKFYTETGYHGN